MSLEECVKELERFGPDYAAIRRHWVIHSSAKAFASVWLLRILLNYGITIDGKTEEIKAVLKSGNYALAVKHRHWFDAIVGYYAIDADVKEPPWPFAKKESFEKKGLKSVVTSLWYRNVGTIPIDRPDKDGSKAVDREFNAVSMLYMMEILRDGEAVIFFPEAHRWPNEMGRCYPLIPGALIELCRNGKEIPVITMGNEYRHPAHPIERNGWAAIRFGPVLRASDYINGNSIRSAVLFASEIGNAIADASNLPRRNSRGQSHSTSLLTS